MSFGFSVGDFLTIIALTNSLRKDFAAAPTQYQAIAAEIKTFSLVLQDIDTYLSANTITPSEKAKLGNAIESGNKTLHDIEKAIAKFAQLESRALGFRERTRRVWDRIQWDPEEIRDFRSRILATTTFLRAIADDFDRKDVATLVSNTSKLVFREQTQADQAILEWLASADYAAQHGIHKRQRLAGTGQWLLESQAFQKWLNLSDYRDAGSAAIDQASVDAASLRSNILLLHGAPGAGKTIIASLCIDHLQLMAAHKENIAVCWYYCDYGRQSAQELETIFASLLRQLVQVTPTGFPSNLAELYKTHQKMSTIPTSAELKDTLKSAINRFQEVYIVVDALDECQLSDRSLSSSIISELLKLSNSTGARLLFTARALPDITNFFRKEELVEIRATDEDVAKFVAANTSRLPKFVGKSSLLQDEIMKTVISAADGVFLLAALHMQALQGARSPRAIRTALKMFGKGSLAFNEAYSKTMNRIVSQVDEQRSLAMDALMWTVLAERSLTSGELLHALATMDGEEVFYEDNISDIEDILSACCGLLVVETESELVRLVHRTSQDYLKENRSVWFKDAQTRMSNVCETYLGYVEQFKKDRNSEQSAPDLDSLFPFYDYAGCFALQHAAMRETPMTMEEVEIMQDHITAATQTLEDDTVSQYLKLYLETPVLKGFHLLASHGATELIPHFLDRYDVNAVDTSGNTPLCYAVRNGHLETSRLLIEHGARLDIPDGEGFFPLHRSVENSNADMIKMLLEAGADRNCLTIAGNTVLSIAIRCFDADTLLLLLEHGCDPFMTDADGISAVSFACGPPPAKMNWIDLRKVRGLLEYIVEGLGISPADIHSASPEVRTKIHKPDARGLTPIIHAMEFYCAYAHVNNKGDISKACITLLLDHGADVNDSDEGERSLISLATEVGDLALIERLMISGARMQETDVLGQTLLHWAVTYEYDQIVDMLLQKGAQPNARCLTGETPLHFAASVEQCKNASLLLRYGADINARENLGMPPLLTAVRMGNENMIRLLIEGGADKDSTDNMGHTALHLAALQASLKEFKCLVEFGADPTITDKSGRGVVEYASSSRTPSMLEYVLAIDDLKGFRATKQPTWSALHWACASGTFDMLIALSDFGIKANIVCTEQPAMNWAPLDLAVYWDNNNLITPEGTLRQDLEWSRLVDSGIVKVNSEDQSIAIVRANDLGPAKKNNSFMCDRCRANPAYGLRFKCKQCTNFDLCLCCKHDSESIHQGHQWDCLEPPDDGSDNGDDGKPFGERIKAEDWMIWTDKGMRLSGLDAPGCD